MDENRFYRTQIGSGEKSRVVIFTDISFYAPPKEDDREMFNYTNENHDFTTDLGSNILLMEAPNRDETTAIIQCRTSKFSFADLMEIVKEELPVSLSGLVIRAKEHNDIDSSLDGTYLVYNAFVVTQE